MFDTSKQRAVEGQVGKDEREKREKEAEALLGRKANWRRKHGGSEEMIWEENAG